MNFEYDPIKSETNKNKHGIDFQGNRILFVTKNTDKKREI
jgi:uncharacterized DUF497 family protein